ncbi:MAG: radical SAM protein [Pirellulaceae bacterium]|nr:radical SAM protein [Pirellulaceae bacterium]
MKPTKQQRNLRLRGIQTNEPLLGPQTVHFDIANGCNVRCTTCWHHSEYLDDNHVPTIDWKRRTMSFESYRRIMDDLVTLGGLENIILSGMGDPSLNKELPEMVRYAHQRGIGVTIITNLLAVDLPSILDSGGELNLLVSICGVSHETWNAFHGGSMAGGLDRLIGQLTLLREADFLPKHVQVINAQNYHELPEMVRFAIKWPTKRINFKFASLVNGTEAVALSTQQKRELIDTLIPRAEAIAQLRGIDTDLDAFRTQVSLQSHATSPIEEVGCYMGTIYCRVTVDQELLYCCNTDISVGFITEDNSFRDLWFGGGYTDLRARLARGEYFDSCQQCGKYKQNYKWHRKLHQLSLATESQNGH